jgi:shikimate 5-dehydrogenase
VYLKTLCYGLCNDAWDTRGLNSIGGAISKDIKHAVLEHLDEIDESAQEVQSVNTVLRKPGTNILVGYNTDAHGFRQAITRGGCACFACIHL